MNASMFNSQLIAVVDRIEAAQNELEQTVRDWAEAERTYRREQARAFLSVEGKNKEEREARAEEFVLPNKVTVSDLRYEAHLKEGVKAAAIEAVRNLRQQLSALQTLGSLAKAEAEFDRTGVRTSA